MTNSKHHFDPEDPRLTAYALGELDPSEIPSVEALIANSAEARDYVEEIQSTAEQLSSGFAALPSEEAGLSHAQREILEREMATTPPAPRTIQISRWRVAQIIVPVGAAAAIVFTMSILMIPQNVSRTDQFTVIEESLPGRVEQPLGIPTRSLLLDDKSESELTAQPKPSPHTVPGLASAPTAGQTRASESFKFGAEFETSMSLSPATQPLAYSTSEYRFDDGLGDTARAPSFAVLDSMPARRQATEQLLLRQTYDYQENWQFDLDLNTEGYDHIVDNPFMLPADDPLSTFSIDVDTASYANVRRMLKSGQLPPPDAVRIEEMINYFDYDYPLPEGDGETPFSVNVDVASCPWNSEHQLMRIGLKGWEIPTEERPAANLVFLIDVSGSMNRANKLPLLKSALSMLTSTLRPDDRVAMVVYAGASGLVLPSTTAENPETIRFALDNLVAGGSTNGGAGIELAYKVATENFITGGINRVILATDGDFNVGTTNQGDLTRLIEEKAKTGVFLTVLGFGIGNYKDNTLETLANKGNGNYAYIDNEAEANKVLVEEVGSTLVTIAKDVKIQIEFNPILVGAYRLIGYENRMLAARDFNDDTKDAGEIGSGHTVTALYEIVPLGLEGSLPQADGSTGESPNVDPLKYQLTQQTTEAAENGELATIKLRYKQPDGDKSTLIEFPVPDSDMAYSDASNDFHFAAAVASFGMLLRGSPYNGDASFDTVLQLLEIGIGDDLHGYRVGFVDLVHKAAAIKQTPQDEPIEALPTLKPADR